MVWGLGPLGTSEGMERVLKGCVNRRDSLHMLHWQGLVFAGRVGSVGFPVNVDSLQRAGVFF